ncbi:elongin-A-like [Empidonax traillii]|uniref:elongin-A-like n=1 Tax=Empidonax traillii TaxID=164674 RepID=UPI000FFD9EDF|nr:elongin-A-like [Empidonax traillii]
MAGRVLELKEQLSRAREPAEIITTLKVLQDLDLSLDILVETGIGKTVNSLRKHVTAGNIAKTLVKKWKKLVSTENKSGHRGKKYTEKEKCETKSSVSKEIKPSKKSRASVQAFRSPNSTPISKTLNKECICSEKTHQSTDSESPKECDNEECSSSGSKHASWGTNSQSKGSEFKGSNSTESKKVSEKQRFSAADKGLSPLGEMSSKDTSEQRSPKRVKKAKQKLVIKSKAKLSSDEEFEPPTMSFESYLNYDQVTNKRKRKARATGARPKKCSEQKNRSLPQKTSKLSHAEEGVEDFKKCESDQSETPSKKAKVASLQELLNTPLPKFLTGISNSYVADFTASVAPVVEAPQQVSEMVQFPGRRVNSKMQVYSGSKTVCLSKMLTLYEQCIRVLQNNIDCRQVKLAYMSSAAKPPRDIRRQQEIHGTAGPVTPFHPIQKTGIPESRDRNNTLSNLIPAGNTGSSSSGVMIQDGKKPIKKIGPIMKKTLKALKSRPGR